MTFQTFTPEQYLKIDIASNFGLDKEDWDIRLDWFDQNLSGIESLLALAERNEETSMQLPTRAIAKHPLMVQADKPVQFFAGVSAWGKVRRGLPIGYPISLDATASGAQLLAILVSCEQSARLCNVVDTGKREDLYTNIYQLMLSTLGTTGVIARSQVKEAVMTGLYGSVAVPRRVFGEGPVLGAFYETLETQATGIWELNQALLGLWNPTALSHDWVLPDNFHVHVKVMDDRTETVEFLGALYDVETKVNRPTTEGLSIGANVIHSIDGMVVREISRRCTYDPEQMLSLLALLRVPAYYQPKRRRAKDDLVETLWDRYLETGFLSARILELLDEENMFLVNKDDIETLIHTMPEKPFPVMAVHDCFRVHPNHGNDLRRQYNQVLSELARSEVLASIATQITQTKVNVTKYGDISSKILDANYALS